MQQNRHFIAWGRPGDSPWGYGAHALSRNASLSLALGLLLAFSAGPAGAWGKPAHRVVASLAEAQLRPEARAEMTRLLQAEPAPASGLAAVAYWADDLREAGGSAARASRRWHFVNFPTGNCEYVPARDCPDGDCVVGAINRQFLRLADQRRSDAERREALKFLVHLVADVHQPLHSTPVNDRGGLEFQVAWHGKGRNLHGVWDGLILDRAMKREGLDEAGYTARLRSLPPLPARVSRRSDRLAAEWAEESCRVVRDGGIYPDSHLLKDDYLDAHAPLAEQRMRLAGHRLADMLNSALAPSPMAEAR